MTDIVERLRAWEPTLANDEAAMLREAADEIDRLRVGLEHIRSLADDIDTAARVALRGQEKP
jgi:cystathionine beta-lyase/cystathionine gamma-synthase